VTLEHHKLAVSCEEQANHYQQGVLCGLAMLYEERTHQGHR